MHKYLCFLGLLLLASCNNLPDEAGERQTVKKFYDLDAYFQAEIKRLSEANITLSKTAELNGKREEITLDEPDWTMELEVFKEADINKPAWWDKYKGDTVLTNGNKIKEVSYQRLDPELATESIFVHFSDRQIPDSISILYNVERSIMVVKKKLLYIPDQYFSIDNTEKLFVGKENKVFLKGMFGTK